MNSEPRSESWNGEVRHLGILGSTGSIGRQTLDIVRLFPDRFDVRVLTCDSNVERLAQQVREFCPQLVAVSGADEQAGLEEVLETMEDPPAVVEGEAGLREAATWSEVDVVMAAVVGFAGLQPVLAALKAGKQVALANKETLVVGGALVERVLEEGTGELIPVDSEHSAIFQCLAGEVEPAVSDIILTASGGPFWERSIQSFGEITVDEALDHPNWSMGPKVTVDSATMMNKGLEVIEAKWLFDVSIDQIQVLVHPQSIIHSMVSFADGAVKAQLGVPDMKVPIQYALSYPTRWPAPHERLDWSEISRLDFAAPDMDKFPCLRLAYEAVEAGGTAPAILNAANEAAVALFLDEQIGFLEIPRIVERTLETVSTASDPSFEEISTADEEARRFVEELALPA